MKEFGTYTIKDLPENERPREKLMKYGVKSLSNAELLAVIIRTGSREDTAVELGRNILQLTSRGISDLANISLEKLMKVKGIGKCKASQILSAIELGKRISYDSALGQARITSPRSIANIFMDDMRFLEKEHFRILTLDSKNQIISTEEISIGTLNASIVHPRDVFKAAISRNANSIILIHNHPSGDTEPSKEDIMVTKRLMEAGNIVGIRVLDHIIIADNRYLSLREKGFI